MSLADSNFDRLKCNMENSLKEMKKTKKELEEQIRQQRLSELDELIQEKGLSFDELKEMLSK